MPASSERFHGTTTSQLTRDKVLGLTDVHPETSKVVRVELLVRGDGGEDLLLNRGGAELLSAFRSLELKLTSMRSRTEGLNM